MTTKTTKKAAPAAKSVPNTVISLDRLKARETEALKANQSADLSVRAARILSARVTNEIDTANVIGKTGENMLHPTWGDYALAIGVTGGSVTGLRRLGRALAVGIDPDGADREVWNLLSSKAGTKEVGALFDGKETAPKIRAGLKKAFTPDGKRVAAPAPQGPRETDEGSKGIDLPRSNSALIDVMEAAWAKMGPLSPAEHKRVAALVEVMSDAQVARKTA